MNNNINGLSDGTNGPKFRMYSEDDMAGIREVISEYFPVDRIDYRIQCFKYAASANPYIEEICPYCIAENNGTVVGYLGQMATRFLVDGKEIRGFYAHDILLKANQRGKGIGTWFIAYQKEVCKTLMAAFWFAPANHRAYQKAGWTDILGLRTLSLHLRADLFISNRIKSEKIANILAGLLNPLLKIRARKWTKTNDDSLRIEKIDVFDESLDYFVEDASHGYGIIMLRRSAMLNWKFAHRSDQSYKFLVLRDSKDIRGYAVLRVFKSKEKLRLGRVVDILVRKSDVEAYKSLIFESMAWFYKEGVHHVSVLTSQKWLMDELRRYGFRRDKDDLAFMITNWKGLCEDDFINKLENWYVTFCDSDYGFWTEG
jgi:GNAT superfamily N-acetyltransferase